MIDFTATTRWLATAMTLPILLASTAQAQYAYPPQQPQYPQQSYPQQQMPMQQQAYAPQPGYAQPNYAQPGYAQQQPYAPQQPYMQQPSMQPMQQPLAAQQLEQLAAPIALYPDTLIALIMTAATYPAQVTAADQWRQSLGNADPNMVVSSANMQPWDPSVKALAAFPQVLAMMDQNMPWTSELGNVYFNQPNDLLQAVQVLRQRAQAAGNLMPTQQQAVTMNQGYIQVAPANPQVVYVPAYNPWTVYGQPIAPYHGFSLLHVLGNVFGAAVNGVGSNGYGGGYGGGSAVRFGLGTVLSAFGSTPWGWVGWGLNWLAHAIFFHDSSYGTASASVVDWGLPHGGPRAYGYGDFYRSHNFSHTYTGGHMYPMNSRPEQSWNRPAYNYGGGYRGGAMPATAFARNEQRGFDNRGFENRGNGFKQERENNGGFHLFGSGKHEDNGFREVKEPKMQSFKEPKMPKMKEPKMSHEGGHGGGEHHSGHHHVL